MDELIRDIRYAAKMTLALPDEAVGGVVAQLAIMAERAADELERRRQGRATNRQMQQQLGTGGQEKMDEYIKRQDAIDALHEAYEARNPEQNGIMDKAVMVVFRLPPADVKPVVRGMWFLHDCGDAVCSICNTWQRGIWDYGCVQKFCGNCGADMRGGDAE